MFIKGADILCKKVKVSTGPQLSLCFTPLITLLPLNWFINTYIMDETFRNPSYQLKNSWNGTYTTKIIHSTFQINQKSARISTRTDVYKHQSPQSFHRFNQQGYIIVLIALAEKLATNIIRSRPLTQQCSWSQTVKRAHVGEAFIWLDTIFLNAAMRLVGEYKEVQGAKFKFVNKDLRLFILFWNKLLTSLNHSLLCLHVYTY